MTDNDLDMKLKLMEANINGYTQGLKDASSTEQEPAYCDRNTCLRNEYNGIGCDECEVTKSQEPSGDAVSRQFMKEMGATCIAKRNNENELIPIIAIDALPSINPQLTGHCKDCKYFEYDSMAKVDGIPLIVAHEICSRWGDGCKTREDGYCFLFEPQESEDEEGEQPKIIKCPNCGNVQFADKEWCPDCGAKMVESQESEVNNG